MLAYLVRLDGLSEISSDSERHAVSESSLVECARFRDEEPREGADDEGGATTVCSLDAEHVETLRFRDLLAVAAAGAGAGAEADATAISASNFSISSAKQLALDGSPSLGP